MKGTAIIYHPDRPPSVRHYDGKAPTLEELQQAVGGFIETVPHFDQITLSGETHTCVALCNEDGKLEGLPLNGAATVLWAEACPGLMSDDGKRYRDVLTGSVIVLYGDAAFMAEL